MCLWNDKYRQLTCKQRASFKLTDLTYVLSNRELAVKRMYGFLNNWYPLLMPVLQCNHNIKLLLNGWVTHDALWYCTNYAAKKQNSTHNQSALIADRFTYHERTTQYAKDVKECSHLLLYHCVNMLNHMTELSRPQVMSYLLDLGDHVSSHKYVPLY